MEDIKNYTLEELEKYIKNKGYPHFYAEQVFIWIYKKRVEDFNSMTDISKEGRKILKDNFYFSHLKLLDKKTSLDGTEKFLFCLEDNSKIESVLIPEDKRNTICLSTQVGCKFGCKFCVSGKDFFKRNLSVSEIISQYLAIADFNHKTTNIVFMGIGEPLDNFTNLMKSIEIFTDSSGINLSSRRICVSTCGLIPEIKLLADSLFNVRLSISLHSADNDIRSKLMPAASKKYPLEDLVDVVKYYYRKKNNFITFEYVLMNINSKREDALKLAKFLGRLNIRYKLNIIPYNLSVAIPLRDSIAFGLEPLVEGLVSAKDAKSFLDTLKSKNIFFTLRKSRGRDIEAACGQLKVKF